MYRRICRSNLAVWVIYQQAESSILRCIMRTASTIPLWFDNVVGNVCICVLDTKNQRLPVHNMCEMWLQHSREDALPPAGLLYVCVQPTGHIGNTSEVSLPHAWCVDTFGS